MLQRHLQKEEIEREIDKLLASDLDPEDMDILYLELNQLLEEKYGEV